MSHFFRKQTGFMVCYLHCKHRSPYGLHAYVCVKYVPVMFVKYSLRWALTTDTNISPPLLSEERHVETLHLHSDHEAELWFLRSFWHLIPHNFSGVKKKLLKAETAIKKTHRLQQHFQVFKTRGKKITSNTLKSGMGFNTYENITKTRVTVSPGQRVMYLVGEAGW